MEAPFLQEARAHPIKRYWLLKTLCLNNLYGVDLMAEAAEIAKLRLFLKLAAQLDNASHIEPLPDLDFNIKSGNLLVGIADAEDIERRFSDRGVLPFGIAEVEDAVESSAVAYEEFVAIQDSTDDQVALHRAKGLLRTRIGWITDQADRGLHKMRGDAVPLETWRETHKPFHWFAEFSTVWRNGGFDVIIGNPPYIRDKDLKAIKRAYTWQGYATRNCPDIYAVCTERASTLVNKRGRIALIVVYSVCYSANYRPLRESLSEMYKTIWLSSFDRSSDSLFSGSAKVRNTIIVGSKRGVSSLFTSRCRGWLVGLRPSLYDFVSYIDPPEEMLSRHTIPWPFVDDYLVAKAFSDLLGNDSEVLHSLLPGVGTSGVRLGYRASAYSMLAVWLEEPPAFNAEGLPDSLDKNKWLYFGTEIERDCAYLILAGRWGFLWWSIYGNARDVTKGVLTSFPANCREMAISEWSDKIQELAAILSEESGRHITWSRRGPVGRQWRVGNYDLRVAECRAVTDEADWLLAQAWGLSREQYEAAGNLRDRMTFGNRE